jgi:leucyl/phenylalanyl-tRNA---protein transferase
MLKDYLKAIIRRFACMVLRVQKHVLPKQILAAHRNGKFPMMERFGFLEWHCPKKRTIIPLCNRFHVGKNLKKLIDKNIFNVTFDRAFCDVIQACAEKKPERGDAWLSPELVQAYIRLHRTGYAHSVEVWHDGRLVGGLYGVAIGGFFTGESTFHSEDNASKVGMVYLVNHLRERGFALHDAQFPSSISNIFGGFEIDRDEYKKLLADAVSRDVRF